MINKIGFKITYLNLHEVSIKLKIPLRGCSINSVYVQHSICNICPQERLAHKYHKPSKPKFPHLRFCMLAI